MDYNKFPIIGPFTGQYRWLSNFHTGYPVQFLGRQWPTREHLYQALKCDDVPRKYELQEEVRLSHLGEVKKLGRKLPIRPDWAWVRINAMIFTVGASLIQHEFYRNELAKTKGSLLVEVNNHRDCFFGHWVHSEDPGLNVLGTVWMGFRDGQFDLRSVGRHIDYMNFAHQQNRLLSFETKPEYVYDDKALITFQKKDGTKRTFHPLDLAYDSKLRLEYEESLPKSESGGVFS